MTSAISCPLWSSVYKCQRVEFAFTSPVRTESGMFVMCCMQCCMSMSAVFSVWMWCLEELYRCLQLGCVCVLNVYLDHLKVLCCVYLLLKVCLL